MSLNPKKIPRVSLIKINEPIKVKERFQNGTGFNSSYCSGLNYELYCIVFKTNDLNERAKAANIAAHYRNLFTNNESLICADSNYTIITLSNGSYYGDPVCPKDEYGFEIRGCSSCKFAAYWGKYKTENSTSYCVKRKEYVTPISYNCKSCRMHDSLGFLSPEETKLGIQKSISQKTTKTAGKAAATNGCLLPILTVLGVVAFCLGSIIF